MTKYAQKFKLDVIQEYLDTGYSQLSLEHKYSLPKGTVKRWWATYNQNGPDGLKLRHSRREFTVDFKLYVIKYYLNNDLSMSEVASTHNLLCSEVSISFKLFKEGVLEALKPKKKGRPSKVSKTSKKNARKMLKKESDEMEALRQELRQVKMERDILKKSLTLFGPSKPKIKR
ncbi:transposase [Ligilactobacillus equi]